MVGIQSPGSLLHMLLTHWVSLGLCFCIATLPSEAQLSHVPSFRVQTSGHAKEACAPLTPPGWSPGACMGRGWLGKLSAKSEWTPSGGLDQLTTPTPSDLRAPKRLHNPGTRAKTLEHPPPHCKGGPPVWVQRADPRRRPAVCVCLKNHSQRAGVPAGQVSGAEWPMTVPRDQGCLVSLRKAELAPSQVDQQPRSWESRWALKSGAL